MYVLSNCPHNIGLIKIQDITDQNHFTKKAYVK